MVIDGQSDLNYILQEGTQWVDSDGDLLGDNWADGSLNEPFHRLACEWVNMLLPDPSP